MDDGIDIERDIKAISEAIVGVMRVVEPMDNPFLALKVLSAVSAFILCYRAKDEDSAHAMFDHFIDDIDDSVSATKTHGMTSWTEGTPH